jgi:predicted nucleic acid-binding protein
MAIVLDTSALIELEKSVAQGKRPVLPADEGVVIPVIVWAETLIGARLADSPARAARRRAQLDAIRQEADIQPFTPEIAEHYADIYAAPSKRPCWSAPTTKRIFAVCRGW